MTSINPTTTYHTTAYFCELTKATYDIEAHYFDLVMQDHEGWSKLADLWSELSSEYGTYIFHDVISFVKYGYDIQEYSVAHQSLIMAVCLEICSDSPGGYAWRRHPFFKRALEEAEPEDDHVYNCRLFSGKRCRVSSQHCYYLEQRMMLRYWISEDICHNECGAASRYIVAYEKFVACLCPKASSWAADHWVDVDHIYNAIQREYGHGYRPSPREYDILINIYRMETSAYTLTGDREHDYLRCVFNLEHFPMQWAQAIWPTDTEKNIIKMYYKAKDFVDHDRAFEDIIRPCYVYDVDDLVFTHSWVYSIVTNWIETGALHTRYACDYKKAMFEISLDI